MYNFEWDLDTRGYILVPSTTGLQKEVRPVFYEELKLMGFDKYWQFPQTDQPLLWAEGPRRYVYQGELVAVAHGGGFYTKPTLDVKKTGLTLIPVDVQAMVDKNKALMRGLVQNSLEFIYSTYQRYRKRRYNVCYVAFSGGKDSLVILDLVQRALAEDEFFVIFGDTGMEIKSTYEAVEKAKARWSKLQFYTAAGRYNPEKTWEEFGPPSRIQRWCCSVHKSAPSLLLLRELADGHNIKALVFDGIRAEESDKRSKYSSITAGGKHSIQVNASPILEWNSAELFLYIFERDLLLNDAYRYGMVRVGCAVCPMSSQWWDYIGYSAYRDDLETYLKKIEQYAEDIGIPEGERRRYIEEGGWKGRAGGRGLRNGGMRVLEQADERCVSFFIYRPKTEWLEWAKALGNTISHGDGFFEQQISDKYYSFSIAKRDDGIKIEFRDIDAVEDKKALSLIRNISNKAAYCIGCQVCMVECPTGALSIDDSGVNIDRALCSKCLKCMEIDKGCLVAKSLTITVGGRNMSLKGINRYQHFGLRQQWLELYFNIGDESRLADKLGNRQLDALRVWLKEAEITENHKITLLGKKLSEVGAGSALTWSIIWTNLAYNSTIVRWYIFNAPWSKAYTKNELIDMLGDDYSPSTRENAITSLIELLRHSPLGDELCFGRLEMQGKTNRVKTIYKTGWEHPDPISVLYALYRYAEKEDGHYTFAFSELVQFNDNMSGISPMALFGTDADEMRKILQRLSMEYPEYIDVEFTRGLDNIFLRKEHTALDALSLIK
jgi:phosphoadenosine phosphosulfate reductase